MSFKFKNNAKVMLTALIAGGTLASSTNPHAIHAEEQEELNIEDIVSDKVNLNAIQDSIKNEIQDVELLVAREGKEEGVIEDLGLVLLSKEATALNTFKDDDKEKEQIKIDIDNNTLINITGKTSYKNKIYYRAEISQREASSLIDNYLEVKEHFDAEGQEGLNLDYEVKELEVIEGEDEVEIIEEVVNEDQENNNFVFFIDGNQVMKDMEYKEVDKKVFALQDTDVISMDDLGSTVEEIKETEPVEVIGENNKWYIVELKEDTLEEVEEETEEQTEEINDENTEETEEETKEEEVNDNGNEDEETGEENEETGEKTEKTTEETTEETKETEEAEKEEETKEIKDEVKERRLGIIPKRRFSDKEVFTPEFKKLKAKKKTKLYENIEEMKESKYHVEEGGKITQLDKSFNWARIELETGEELFAKLEDFEELEELTFEEEEEEIEEVGNTSSTTTYVRQRPQERKPIVRKRKVRKVKKVITDDEIEYKKAQGEPIGQQVVDFALQFVGGRYVWGGNSLETGVDCSGFTREVYKRFGVNLPRHSSQQGRYGREVSLQEALPGDIVHYDGHVAIYMGNNKIVHAANSRKGIITSNINYTGKYNSIRRIIEH